MGKDRKESQSFGRRYLRATRLPLSLALLFSSIVWLTQSEGVLKGGTATVSVAIVVASYVVIALLAALMAVLFREWATTRLRGALIGFMTSALVALLFNFSLAFMFDGPLFGRKLAFFVIFAGFVPGSYLGAMFWEKRQKM